MVPLPEGKTQVLGPHSLGCLIMSCRLRGEWRHADVTPPRYDLPPYAGLQNREVVMDGDLENIMLALVA